MNINCFKRIILAMMLVTSLGAYSSEGELLEKERKELILRREIMRSHEELFKKLKVTEHSLSTIMCDLLYLQNLVNTIESVDPNLREYSEALCGYVAYLLQEVRAMRAYTNYE